MTLMMTDILMEWTKYLRFEALNLYRAHFPIPSLIRAVRNRLPPIDTSNFQVKNPGFKPVVKRRDSGPGA